MGRATKATATYRGVKAVKRVRIAPDAIELKRARLPSWHRRGGRDDGDDDEKGSILLRDDDRAKVETQKLNREGNRVDCMDGAVALLSTFRNGRLQVLRLECCRRLVVGRYEQCDYVLAERSASSVHFVLFAYRTDSGEIFVSCEDKSTNGLIWNGRRIQKTSVLLSEGDRIGIPGSQSFLFKPLTGYTKESTESRATIGSYKISDRILGTGSFGKVYLAYNETSRRQAACKVQNKAACNMDASGMDLKWEIDILKRISHPNINDLYDVHDDGVNVRLFLQLVAGGDLFEYIVRQRQLQDDVAKFIVYQLAVALTYLHSNGIAHRDIKPENVLIMRGSSMMPHILLGDFGLAYDAAERYADDPDAAVLRPKDGCGSWSAKTKSHVGTPSYLAREALLSRYSGAYYDPFKMDAWSLGVMLFFMLNGIHPFDYGSAEPMIVTRSLVERQLILDGKVALPPDCTLEEVRAKQAQHPSAPLVQRILHIDIIWHFAGSAQIAESVRHLIVELLDAVPEKRRAVSSLFDAEWIASDLDSLRKAYDAIVLAM